MRKSPFKRVISAIILVVLLIPTSARANPASKAGAEGMVLSVAQPTTERVAPNESEKTPPSWLPAANGRPEVRLVRWEPESGRAVYRPEMIPTEPVGEPVFLGYLTGTSVLAECGQPFEQVRWTPGYLGDGDDCFSEGWIDGLQFLEKPIVYRDVPDGGFVGHDGPGQAYLHAVGDALWWSMIDEENFPHQMHQPVSCPWPERGFGACTNGWGEHYAVIEVWGNAFPPAITNDRVVVNRRTIFLNHPLKKRTDEDYIAIDAGDLREMGFNLLEGQNYIWIGNRTRTLGLWKAGAYQLPAPYLNQDFLLLDGSPEKYPLDLVWDSDEAAFYAPFTQLAFRLGASNLNQHNGIWELDMPPDDPFKDPWRQACWRHGYSLNSFVNCPMDEFVHIPYLTWAAMEPGSVVTELLPIENYMEPLRKMEQLVGPFGPQFAKSDGGWKRGTPPQEWMGFMSEQGAYLLQADYNYWRAVYDTAEDAITDLATAALLLMISKGILEIPWFPWWKSPPKNIAVPEQIKVEVTGALAKADELEAAAIQQGLGHGYPLVTIGKRPPGPGTFAKIVLMNEGYTIQSKLGGYPEPQMIKGFGGRFAVVLEQATWEGGPWLDRVGALNGQVYVWEFKGNYPERFLDGRQFQPWYANSGAQALLRELEAQANVAKEMGWKVRWVTTPSSVNVMKALQNLAKETLPPEVLETVEFVVVKSTTTPLLPPVPPPGEWPFTFRDLQGTKNGPGLEILR